jgi:hypothetical protein
MPPIYDADEQDGWGLLAKSIVNSGTLIVNSIKNIQHTREIHDGNFNPFYSNVMSG